MCPEVVEGVFNGSSGECEFELGVDLEECLCGFGCPLFDYGGGFVQDEAVEGVLFEVLDVVSDESIGGDDDVGVLEVEGLSGCAVVEGGSELWCEVVGFGLPLVD